MNKVQEWKNTIKSLTTYKQREDTLIRNFKEIVHRTISMGIHCQNIGSSNRTIGGEWEAIIRKWCDYEINGRWVKVKMDRMNLVQKWKDLRAYKQREKILIRDLQVFTLCSISGEYTEATIEILKIIEKEYVGTIRKWLDYEINGRA